MSFIAIVVGIILVVSVLAHLVNTLVTTTTSHWPWWLTQIRGFWGHEIGHRLVNLNAQIPREHWPHADS